LVYPIHLIKVSSRGSSRQFGRKLSWFWRPGINPQGFFQRRL